MFEEIKNQLPSEMNRLKNLSSTLKGLMDLIAIYETNFEEKYEHGCDVVYELSRVNIIRKMNGQTALI